ncbi:2,3-bisphosphoglycerate-independent phosphoglycerate mutase, partial [bacterium]|nr:2,3-bisphosphoglycerate-independent phosphoglycerate mutase [bacterium]
MSEELVNVQPVALVILDGWGIADPSPGNALAAAKTPVFDRLFQGPLATKLGASALDVGLPAGQMGNSEVGHTNIGAGRIVYQDLTRISRAISDGSIADNKAFAKAFAKAGEKGQALHLLGLLSDGGVHSHQDHLEALLRLAAEQGLKRVYVHAFLDGRDTPPNSAIDYVRRLEKFLDELGTGKLASLGGRFYGMDRDQRWERVERHWRTLVLGEGPEFADAVEAVAESYGRKVFDEFVEPLIVTVDGAEKPLIKSGDGVIFFNFRGDRARELTMALTQNDFTGFKRPVFPQLGAYVCMSEYDDELVLPVAFPRQSLENGLGEVVAGLGLTQLRIAETEKYAHVTFFFNGGREQPYPGEERLLIPSPRDVKTYDLKPEMSARQVATELVVRLEQKNYALTVLNFANCDMVGHTGFIDATIKACETVDDCLGIILGKFKEKGIVTLITADHGNA